MKSYFGDASYYIALVNREDVSHAKAVTLVSNLRLPVVTAMFVLAEVAGALSQPRNRRLAIDPILDLQNDPAVTILSDDKSLSAALLR
ncbi:hypothetical protein HYR69_00850 [Candidatus Sumerlaeota bacterium]|nr:hypothetical protein [Candidatus Sumerlaeota bacterium]MBI3737397.1 hypothetical protein [Candidatus Sumerlaeota bacterium]